MAIDGVQTYVYRQEMVARGWERNSIWSETEGNGPRVPTGSPRPVRPQEMRSIEEIKKGLDGYIEYWTKMANSDESGEFRRTPYSLK